MRYQESFGIYRPAVASSDRGTTGGCGERWFSGWKATCPSQIETQSRHDGSNSSCCRANWPDQTNRSSAEAKRQIQKSARLTKVVPSNFYPLNAAPSSPYSSEISPSEIALFNVRARLDSSPRTSNTPLSGCLSPRVIRRMIYDCGSTWRWHKYIAWN